MWSYGWHMGGMWFGWAFVLLVVIVAAIWAVSVGPRRTVPHGGEDPETVLKRRYARGEIDREEFTRRLDDIRH